mgnify:FL=1|tara:strand:+ start:430 stop:984 length:555 start_codon:yes stop_codon:yes gene_type:complete
MLKIEEKKIKVSWDDVEEAVKKLCDIIKPEIDNVSSIHGISRGGLIPAVMVSHRLGLPYVDVPIKNTMVIDDICDSGVTLRDYKATWKGALWFKPNTSCFTPTCWAEEHLGDEWLIFPWEKSNSEPIQDYLKTKEFKEFAENEDNSVVWPEEDSKLHTVGGLTNDKEGSFMEFLNKIDKKNKNG